MWSEATATVTVGGGSNLPPIITNQSFSIVANPPGGTQVGTVVATDPNAGQTISFSITSGNTNNAFNISPSSGLITVGNSSAVNPGVFDLSVRATDNGSPVMWSQATVSITVTAAANQAPVINNQSFNTIQGSSNGTVVGTVVATDPNAGQTLSFSITGGNTNNVFAIVAATGVITVANTSAMNTGVINLTVRATDNGSPVMWSQATVSITVTAAGGNLPPVVVNQSFSSAPNPSNHTNIGIMIATDPNPGQTLRYNITGGNTNNAFYILSSSGMIRVANSSAVNPGVFNLTVRVTDNGSPVMWSEATATITVAGNQPPVITNQSFSIAANPPGGTQVGTVVATDPNAGQTISFSITSGNTNNAFNISPSSGLITVGNSSAVNPGVFTLTVRATDNGSPVMWSQATVSITVTASGGNLPPVVVNQSFSCAANPPIGTNIGIMIATDPNPEQTLRYNITGGNTNNAFYILSATGMIRVASSSAVNPGVFILTVRVTDNGSPVMWSEATATLTVGGGNKNGLVEDGFTPESKVDPVFNIFPNPSSDGIYTLSAENFEDEAVIQIFDLAGKMVSEVNNFSGDRVSINLEAMPKGVYMIRITAGSFTKTIKAIKQ
jgi:hypothetical protein